MNFFFLHFLRVGVEAGSGNLSPLEEGLRVKFLSPSGLGAGPRETGADKLASRPVAMSR